MGDVWIGDKIPYKDQADKLFNLVAWEQKKTEKPQVIPFLGAGVPISARPATPKPAALAPPDPVLLDSFSQQLGLDQSNAKLFLRMAAFIAVCLNKAEKDSPDVSDDQLLDLLQQDQTPPSARQLARLFCNLSTYSSLEQVVDNLQDFFPAGFINASRTEQVNTLKRLGRITRLADPPDPLTSITSYYENKVGRDSLWFNLGRVISGKNQTTNTHALIAAAAKQHSAQHSRPAQDYLILTTNYDCLMEDALDKAKVDYVVLTMRKSDQKVLVRFSDGIDDHEKLSKEHTEKFYPQQFYMEKTEPLVLVCKMHGCLNPRLNLADDGVIISDNDYVDYIEQMNSTQGTIPAYVRKIMQDKPFLFLGYSFGDWNVRSVFQSIRKKRSENLKFRDFAVTSYLGEYEQQFFHTNNVAVLKTDLNTFSEGLVNDLKKRKDNNPQKWGPIVDNILSTISTSKSN
jgi:SIR2-like domain